MSRTPFIRPQALACAALCLCVAVPLHAQELPPLTAPDFPYCQVADRRVDPDWAVEARYFSREALERTSDDLGFMQTTAGSSIYYLRTPFGNLDFGTSLDHRLVIGGDDLELPDSLLRLSGHVRWDLRTRDALTFRLNAHPGLHSSLEDVDFNDVFVPFEVMGIQAFDATVSAWFGVAVFPGFLRVADARAGVRWAATDDVMVDVAYPVTRVLFKPAVDWELSGGFGFHRTDAYQLADDDPRDLLQLDETRAFVGLDYIPDPAFRLGLQVGYTFSRSLAFAHGRPEEYELDPGWFAGFRVGGSF